MKIHSISLKNIHSLKGTHKVNFTSGPLSQTGLFAIIGPTGSGKSTLLDAITLALYNSTPRNGNLSKASIEKTGAIITRNTGDAFCEVEYETNNTIYRSKWSISRARTGNLRDYHMEISAMDAGGKFKPLDIKKGEVPEKNSQIIGLNYDQFIKSILLSQGEFAKFLKSTPKERSALLEKITGTGIYTMIGTAAFEKQKEERAKLDKLRERLGDIRLLDAEEIKSIGEEIESLELVASAEREKLSELSEMISIKKQLSQKKELENELKVRLTKLKAQREAMHDDESRLAVHNYLLPYKSDIDRLLWLEKQIAKHQSVKIDLAESLEKLASEKVDLKQQSDQQAEKLEEDKHKYHRMLPVLKKVKETDEEIKVERAKTGQIEQQFNKIQKEISLEQKQVEELQNELNGIITKLESIKKFQSENSEAEGLIEDLPGIVSQRKRIIAQLGVLDEKVKENTPELYKTFGKAETPKEKKKVIESKIQNYQDEKNTIKSSLGSTPPDSTVIVGEIEKNTNLLHNLKELLRLSSSILKLIEDWRAVGRKVKNLEEKLNQIKTEKEDFENKQRISEKYIEELQIRKEREALEAKYEDDRKSLKPGEACPLCGSKEHPLVATYQDTINTTGELLKVKKEEHKKLSEKLSALNDAASKTSAEITSRNEMLPGLKSEIEKTTLEFTGLNDANGMSFRPADTEQLENSRQETEVKIQKLRHDYDLSAKWMKLTESLNTLSYLAGEVDDMVKSENEMMQSVAPYSKFYTENDTIDVMIQKLETILRYHKEAIRQKTDFREKEMNVSSKIRNKEEQISKLKIEWKEVEHNLNLLKEKLADLSHGREKLFGNKDPEKEEKALRDMVSASEKNIANLEKLLGLNANTEQNLLGQRKKLIEELDEMNAETNHLNTKLAPVIGKFSFDSPSDAAKEIMGEDEARAIKEHIEALKADMDKTMQSAADIKEEIAGLLTKDDDQKTLDELETAKKDRDRLLAETLQQKGKLTARLDFDRENRDQSTAIHAEIARQEKEFARWDALGNLIGDAKGTKFSRFAQQLTLVQMLAKANRHLTRLTERYIIIIENTGENDELFVIDTWHGDEKRSVKTLSGGESFLVSLALALGLSDLAGSKTSINSLFIDEGFGSLDQETLDIALSTLERLQYETNRTIGIISHVEALKERITTQVELTLDTAGNSSLMIKS